MLEKGYVDIPVDSSLDLKAEIRKLLKEKNAILLCHFYQSGEIQDIADYLGDSLNLSREAEKTNADIIVFAGVHFMAETAKILNPSKKVIIPDLNAGCSLADSITEIKFAAFKKQYPDHIVISYVNTTAQIKAMSDIICTSSNAVKIVNSLPANAKIIFTPDRNLGNYINSVTGRNMIVWDGACHVHEEFSVENIVELKNSYPNAKVVAHPECKSPVLVLADYIGSTNAMLDYVTKSDNKEFIVATESGILHQMKKYNPGKVFYAVPPKDSTCGCTDCNYMKLNTLEKIYNCLKYEQPEIVIEEGLRKQAEKSIRRMLELS